MHLPNRSIIFKRSLNIDSAFTKEHIIAIGTVIPESHLDRTFHQALAINSSKE